MRLLATCDRLSSSQPRLSLVCAAIILVLGVVVCEGQAASHVVYVAVADDHGSPIPGLSAVDFSMQVDGKSHAPARVVPATVPMSIAVLVDVFDNVNETRAQTAMKSVIAMIRRSAPGSRVGFSGLSKSASPEASAFGLGRSLAQGSILDRIIDAAAALRTEPNERRVIFVVSAEALEIRLTPKTVVAALHDAGASLWNMNVSSPRLGTADESVSSWSAEQGDQDKIFDTAVKASGGARETIFGAASLEATAARMINLLCSAYAIDLGPVPSGPHTLRVGVTRKNAKVYAPSWLGQ
jgi:hypothetical protein